MNPYQIVLVIFALVSMWSIFSSQRLPIGVVFALLTTLLGAGLATYYGIGEGQSLPTAIVNGVLSLVGIISFVRQLKHCSSGEQRLKIAVPMFFLMVLVCLMSLLSAYSIVESGSISFAVGYGLIGLMALLKTIHMQVVYSRNELA